MIILTSLYFKINNYKIDSIVITFKLGYIYFFLTKSFNDCMLYFLVLSGLPYFDFPISSGCISMDQQKWNKLTIMTFTVWA
jgi:hypothetical protein